MTDTINALAAEITRLQAEIVNVERMQPTIAERFAAAEAELRDAEALYRAEGSKVSAAHPAQTAHLQRLAVIGACMVVGADKLLQVERQRVEAGGEGMSVPDKARRLAVLRRQIAQAAARRELLLGGDFLAPRPVHRSPRPGWSIAPTTTTARPS
jgi:septum formation inhibitor MinC